jgi:colanic acid/amylovoran biosynthesis glycosyltransferase
MKIAFFRKKYLGLSETFIYHYVANLKRYDPIFLTYKRIPSAAHFPLANVYTTAPQKRWSQQWFWAKVDTRLRKRTPVIGILERNHVQLLHGHFGPDSCIALPWAKELGIPLVGSFYGFDLFKQDIVEHWIDRYRVLFEQGALFLVEGSHMRARLLDLGCPSEKALIQKIAIDVDQIPFSARKLASGEPVRLLFCGRFVEKKGLQDCLLALAEVVKTRVPVKLRVVGDGELRPTAEQLIDRLNLRDYVDMVGLIPYTDLKEELKAAHILLAPSVTAQDGDSEGGAPTILLDAQASGLPVVSTFHADIPEIVLDGQSAYLTPEHDPAALAESIISLISQADKWPEMGAAGRAFMKKNHDIRVLVPQLEEKYNQILQHGSTLPQ